MANRVILHVDLNSFFADQRRFHMQALALRLDKLSNDIAKVTSGKELQATVYMQPHGKLADIIYKYDDSKANYGTNKQTVNSGSAASTIKKVTPAAKAQTTESVEQAASARQQLKPALRGPIEMDPQTATMLNTIQESKKD